MNSLKKVVIYTDGACRGNPGNGGWGAILNYQDQTKEIKGFASNTTNNIMELTAVIKSIELLKEPCQITVFTDSKYVQNGISTWIHGWKKNGWKTSNKKSVKNKNLWLALDDQAAKHNISWEWVKGHSGHPLNERADELANQAIDEGKI
jgi:ribonuclease HI